MTLFGIHKTSAIIRQKIWLTLSMGILLVVLASCNGKPKHQGSLSFFIPENSVLVARTSSLTDLASDLENNNLFSELNKESWYQEVSSKLGPLSRLQLKGNSLICMGISNDSVIDFTLITKLHSGLFIGDTITQPRLANLVNAKTTLDTIQVGGQAYHFTVIDSIVVASTSTTLTSKAKTSNGFNSATFNRIDKSLVQDGPVIFMRKQGATNWINTILPNAETTGNWFGDWTGLSLELAPGALRFSGVTTAVDSLEFLSSFSTTKADSITAAAVTPSAAKALFSFTYQDFQQLRYKDTITPAAQLLGTSASELSAVVLENSKALLAKTIDPGIAMELLAPYINPEEEFRGIMRFSLNDSLYLENLVKPVLDSVRAKVVFALDEYLIFTADLSSSQAVIQAYLNNNTLAQQNNFKETITSLGTASHMLFVAKRAYFTNQLNAQIRPEYATSFKANSFKQHEFFAMQFTQELTYAHVHGIAKEKIQGTTTNGIRELLTINPKDALIGPPQFFSNHRTRGKDIVFQDVQNKLHFYAANGKLLWSKQLDGPILGKIKEVDLLRNGKKQLAFCTANSLAILDRNGNPVAPFPIKFKNTVTQPLAVFDYDNNRKYRFVVTQNDEILMYNSQAKIVKGFTYTKARASLAFAPRHYRVGSRDYIVVALTSGDLKVLSRVGKDRINISKNFAFGAIPVYSEDGAFIVIDRDFNKITINQAGSVTTKALGVAEGFTFNLAGKNKASLDENLLRINGRLYELPYGVYSAPQLFGIGREQFVSVTDLQEQKVYVFNTQAELLPNFPIYGTGPAVLGDANRNRRTNILVPGDGNSILLYEIQ